MGVYIEGEEPAAATSAFSSGQRSQTQWVQDEDGEMVLNIGGPSAPAPAAKRSASSQAAAGEMFAGMYDGDKPKKYSRRSRRSRGRSAPSVSRALPADIW